MTMTIDDIVDLIHTDVHHQLDELLAILRPDRFPEGCTEKDLIVTAEGYRNRRIEEAERFFELWSIVVPTEGWTIWSELGHLTDEVAEWADENLQGYWNYHKDLKMVCFENEVDAVHFKLQWR